KKAVDEEKEEASVVEIVSEPETKRGESVTAIVMPDALEGGTATSSEGLTGSQVPGAGAGLFSQSAQSGGAEVAGLVPDVDEDQETHRKESRRRRSHSGSRRGKRSQSSRSKNKARGGSGRLIFAGLFLVGLFLAAYYYRVINAPQKTDPNVPGAAKNGPTAAASGTIPEEEGGNSRGAVPRMLGNGNRNPSNPRQPLGLTDPSRSTPQAVAPPSLQNMMGEPTDPPRDPRSSVKINDAMASLEGFLSATTAGERAGYILNPKQNEPLMRTFYAWAERALPVYERDYIKYAGEGLTADQQRFTSYHVRFRGNPRDIQVRMVETADGYRFDWKGFEQFKHGLFEKYLDGKFGLWTDFRLEMRPESPNEGIPNQENKRWFKVTSPYSKGVASSAYVEEATPLSNTVSQVFTDSGSQPVVVRVERLRSPDNQVYLRLQELVGQSWN
ncbi:MAG: hypothetical protein AAF514_20715, partial [Verrucomicrobiota bacterium]